jgi:hypothetical protein
MSLHHIVKTALHLRSVEVKLVFQKKRTIDSVDWVQRNEAGPCISSAGYVVPPQSTGSFSARSRALLKKAPSIDAQAKAETQGLKSDKPVTGTRGRTFSVCVRERPTRRRPHRAPVRPFFALIEET